MKRRYRVAYRYLGTAYTQAEDMRSVYDSKHWTKEGAMRDVYYLQWLTDARGFQKVAGYPIQWYAYDARTGEEIRY